MDIQLNRVAGKLPVGNSPIELKWPIHLGEWKWPIMRNIKLHINIICMECSFYKTVAGAVLKKMFTNWIKWTERGLSEDMKRFKIQHGISSRCLARNKLKQTHKPAQHNLLQHWNAAGKKKKVQTLSNPLFITSPNILARHPPHLSPPMSAAPGCAVERMCRLKGPLEPQWHCILYHRGVWWDCRAKVLCNPSWRYKQFEISRRPKRS